MTYTEEEKRTLSRKVAEKCGIEDGSGEIFSGRDSCGNSVYKWLHDDWHTIMELCVKHGVDVEHKASSESLVEIRYAKAKTKIGQWFIVRYDFANNNPSEAERIARLLALCNH